MNSIGLSIVAAIAGFVCSDDTLKVIRFGKSDLGKAPVGWTIAKTGQGEGSVWKVIEDKSAPSKSGFVLAQTAESPNAMFNLCVVDKIKAKDVEVSVAFKPNKGNLDQGGGIVWRYQDADNYYIARMNPLENNLRVYKVIAGKRIQLATKEELPAKAGEWHTIRIEHKGKKNEIECYFNGKKLLSVDNETTIDKPGKVGLWTKADAQTSFDELRIIGASE